MVNTLVVVLLLGALSAQPVSMETGGVKWQSNYTKALRASRENARPLLVVLDIPGKPKESLTAEHLDIDGEQGDLLESYQLCHVDVSTNYGKKVATAFQAKEFPFTAIIDKNGEYVLVKKAGQISEVEWEATLAKYQQGVKPLKTYSTFYRGDVNAAISATNTDCTECQLRAMREAQQQK